jgi:hypothetical protein
MEEKNNAVSVGTCDTNNHVTLGSQTYNNLLTADPSIV